MIENYGKQTSFFRTEIFDLVVFAGHPFGESAYIEDRSYIRN